MLSFDFSGRVAVITGAGGGMGEATAAAFLAGGGSAILIDLKPPPAALAGHPAVSYAQGDLTDAAFLDQAIGEGARRFGRIDYLANIAGVLWFGRDRSALEIDVDLWRRVFAVNLESMALAARAATPHMLRSGGGAMVHFSSVQALRGDTVPQDAYAASKAAVGALSRSLAMQLAPQGIRSNTIYPGLTLTPMQARWDTPEKLAAVGAQIPLGRVADPRELASAALFLLSDGASYITGIDLIVDGGLLLKY